VLKAQQRRPSQLHCHHYHAELRCEQAPFPQPIERADAIRLDLTVLDGNSRNLLRAPSSAIPAFIAFSLALTVFFFILFTLISLRHKLGKFGGRLESPLLQRVAAWIGVFGFLVGLSAFLILRLWFGKAIDDFNTASMLNNDDVLAQSGNGFISAFA
jgi:hypothetical protein